MGTRDLDQAVDEVIGDAGPADIDQQHADPMNHPPVRVAHAGPVMVQQLPADGPWGSKTRSLVAADAVGVNLLKPDGRRVSALLVGTVAFRVGPTQADAAAGAVWPANVPLPIHTNGEIWIAYNAADSVVSVVWESWTK